MPFHGVSTSIRPSHPRRGLLLGAIALTLLAVAATVLIIQYHNSAASSLPRTTDSHGAPALVPIAAGQGWSVSASPNYGGNGNIIALRWDSSTPEVELLDGTTGQVQAKIQTSYNPFVLRRPSFHELLISDDPIQQVGARTQASPRLLVFDTAHKLALKQIIPLPNRIAYTVYAPRAMALSANERYLFYVTHEYRQGAPPCGSGGDAATCDLNSVAALDLSTGSTRPVPLPQGCGYAELQPSGASSVVATCPDNGRLQVISADGSIAQQANFNAARSPEPASTSKKGKVRALFSDVISSGQTGTLLADGTFLKENSSGVAATSRTLPANMVVVPLGQVYQERNDTLIIGYAGYGQGYPSGFVVFDPTTMRVERNVKLSGATSIAPHDGAVLALRKDGTVLSVDPSTGAERVLPGRFDIKAGPLVP